MNPKKPIRILTNYENLIQAVGLELSNTIVYDYHESSNEIMDYICKDCGQLVPLEILEISLYEQDKKEK